MDMIFGQFYTIPYFEYTSSAEMLDPFL